MRAKHAKRFAGFLSLAAVMAAGGASAGEAVLKKNDGNANPSAFNGRAGYWNPDILPTSDEGKETDYIVKNGLQLRTPDGNSGAVTFQGRSLTLGASDYSSAGSILYKSNGFTITIPNLIVYQGSISTGTSYDGGGYSTHIAGNATLHTTFDDPFSFAFGTTKNHKGGTFELTLTGDETTAIKVYGADPTVALPLRADQSKTYSGGWIFGANQYIYVDGGYKVGNTYINLNSQTVFGKPLAKFNPKSIQFGDGVSLRYEPRNSKALPASDNRGITIADGGTVTFLLYNGYTVDCGYPIAGKDTTVKTDVNGTLVLRTTSEAKLVPTSTSSIALVGNAAVDGGIAVSNGTVVAIGEKATDRVTATGAWMKNPLFKFIVAADGSDASQLRLSGDLDFNCRVGLMFNQVPMVTATKDIPVLVIDKSVEREFAADDFDAQVGNAEAVVVSRNADGDQVVSVRVTPCVRSNAPSSPGFSRTNTAGDWTPSGVPVNGKTYVVCGQTFRAGGGYEDNKDITVAGDYVLCNGGSYGSKPKITRFQHVVMMNDTSMSPAQTGSFTMEWAGLGFTVKTTPGKYASFINTSMAGGIVSAPISGYGTIRAVCASGDSFAYRPYISFTGDNSGFVGTFLAVNNSIGVNYCPLKAGSEENFGGNPETFAADAWKISQAVEFTPTAPVTIDDPNRGVTLGDGSGVNTAAGDFIVKTPTVIEGAFRKNGAGTFAYGKGGVTVAEGAAITVNGGAIRPEHRDALKGAKLAFAEGAALAFSFPYAAGDSRAEAGLDLTTAAMEMPSAKLTVRLDVDPDADMEAFGGGALPLATFASADVAQAVLANVELSVPKGYQATLHADGATVYADVIKKGMKVIVR